ncbi:MAG: hypothetical protein KGO53_14015 [Alphaproteobacteria bacterium]|nr:hypothetical protein [Alphaproteobacteria bacterium]
MNKHIHIRDFDGAAHRKLAERARKQGLSLSSYLRFELARLADRPSMDDVLNRLKKREPMGLSPSAADIIRQDRDSR